MSINLLTGKPLLPVGISKETREAIHRLGRSHFELMGKSRSFEQTEEIDRAYDEIRKDLLTVTGE